MGAFTADRGDRVSFPRQGGELHKQVRPIPIRLGTSFPRRTISFVHSGSICCCSASGNAASLSTQFPHRHHLCLIWSYLTLWASVTTFTAAYDSFQRQWLCNCVAAIFGNDFGVLVTKKARSATKIMILSDHLGASVWRWKCNISHNYSVICG